MKKLCIVIPAYNEDKRITEKLNEYYKYFIDLKKQKILDFEIIVVINRSTDRTEEIVKVFSKKYNEVKYMHLKQKGKGLAIIEGFKDALKRNNDLIGFVDADMSTKPQDYYDLVKNINKHDGIIASRYHSGAIVNPKQTMQRIIASRIFNFWVNLILGLNYKDTQCGAKVFRREVIESVINHLTITKWAFDVDLLHKIKKEKKYLIKEFPTVWSDSEYSTINFKRAGPLMALAVIRLRLLSSPVKGIIKIYDRQPEWIKIHHRI